MFTTWCIREKLLSARAIGTIHQKCIDDGPTWGDEEHQNGGEDFSQMEPPLHTTAVRVLLQSYTLALAHPRPPLFIAIFVIQVLRDIAEQPGNTRKDAHDALQTISNLDDESRVRVLYLTRRLKKDERIDATLFLSTAIADMHRMIASKTYVGSSRLILGRIFEIGNFARCDNEDMKELMYLSVHVLMANKEYIRVTQLRDYEMFSTAFSSLEVGEGKSLGISLGIGQAWEALGDFESAISIYRRFGHTDRAEKAERILRENLSYWKKGSVSFALTSDGQSIKKLEILAIWEMEHATIHPKFGLLAEVHFVPPSPAVARVEVPNLILMVSGAGDYAIQSCPSENWTALEVIPSLSPENCTEFGVLVLNSCEPGSDCISRMDLFGSMMHPNKRTVPVELWAVDKHLLTWKRVVVFGDVPVQGRPLKASIVVAKTDVYVFRSDCTLMTAGRDYGVYTLHLPTLTWTKLSHPFFIGNHLYRATHSCPLIDSNPRLPEMRQLPNFPQALTTLTTINNTPAIAFLRSQTARDKVTVVQSEVVPKYILDYLLLGVREGETARQYQWVLDVPTSDLSGYRASSLHGAVFPSSDCLAVIGYGSNNTVFRVQEDGKISFDFDTPTAPGHLDVKSPL